MKNIFCLRTTRNIISFLFDNSRGIANIVYNNINNEAVEMLNYQKKELIEHNVSKIMLPILGSLLPAMIRNYLTSDEIIENEENSIVFPIHKSGYFIPCSLMQRIISSTNTGIQFVHMLHQIQDLSDAIPILEPKTFSENSVILLTDEALNIQSFNKKASSFFGIDIEQSNLKKYNNSNEKISSASLIKELTDEFFVSNLLNNELSTVRLDIETIRKAVNSEIEVIEDQNKKTEVTSLSLHKSESPLEIHSPSEDFTCSVNIGIHTMEFGKFPSTGNSFLVLRLIILFFDHNPVINSSPKEYDLNCASFTEQQKKCEDNMAFEDAASVSQSSASSSLNPQSTQNSIKTFKECIIRLENPFFVRCFRKLSIVIFLIIFGTSIFEYIFTVSTLQFVKNSFDYANVIHYRLSNYIELPQIYRIIQNMYQNIETQTSEVYTIVQYQILPFFVKGKQVDMNNAG